jgi:signal peptidase I
VKQAADELASPLTTPSTGAAQGKIFEPDPARGIHSAFPSPAQFALAPHVNCAETFQTPQFLKHQVAHMTNEAKSSGPPCARPGATGWPEWLRIAIFGRRPRFTLARIVVLVIVVFVVFGFMLLPIRINGPSMLPTYPNGGVNVINRLAYLRHEPRRGDVVAIRISGTEYSAGELVRDLAHVRLKWGRVFRPSMMYMKRIVGLPGETVAFVHGHATINGQILTEPYVKTPCDWEREPVKIGPDEYFCVGDNRSMPQEYHTFGRAPRDRIVGKILL